MAIRGRPRKNPVKKSTGCRKKIIDWEYVKQMCEIGCSGMEIAACLGIHFETLYDRCEKEFEIGWSHFSQIYRQRGDVHLRKLQQQLADEKDRGMLIWLGKNRLKQKDKPDDDINDMEKDLEYLQKKIEAYKKVNED